MIFFLSCQALFVPRPKLPEAALRNTLRIGYPHAQLSRQSCRAYASQQPGSGALWWTVVGPREVDPPEYRRIFWMDKKNLPRYFHLSRSDARKHMHFALESRDKSA